MSSSSSVQREGVFLDIGGEGRHADAWNLNPSRVRTMGKHRGSSIPRLILGRADGIPFADRSVEKIIVERTPLRGAALAEMARVIVPHGTIILRHAITPCGNPHALAESVLPGRKSRRLFQRGALLMQETRFQLAGNSQGPHVDAASRMAP
jgi:hypothetical protein